MKKIIVSVVACSSLVLGASNEELSYEIELLKQEMKQMKQEQSQTNDSILEEVVNMSGSSASKYESFSSLGEGASKVYHTNNSVSIGGYGEYKFKKYDDYKNSTSSTYNDNKNKGEFNIVRFVPYIGFKFNDWIVMNTEIEFEDGGARSDGTKNYKYAIVEFSYLDFLISESFAIRVGHILTPFGLVNLNHEPTSYLTSDRPAVETYIIPSTWHTNGILSHGKIDEFEYYAGFITSPDSDAFGDAEGRFIQQGRLGAKQYTDSYSFVARGTYNFGDGLNMGASFMYGQSEGSDSKVDVTMTMAEVHATYKNHGFDIQALATFGKLGGDVSNLPTATDVNIADSVNGQYLTVGYDILSMLEMSHKGYLVAEIERLDMDANSQTTYVDNNRFFEYTVGFAYFPDSKIALKADYKLRDYGSNAKFSDENSFTLSAGFIF
ncbi:hypothetical protein FJR48_09815 [Sulfurimonas lithotrophica]|uniref:Porin n=1 Tax=Sulfurimonas lithotrophica TaxID=2590022 RepID=A0A5P8P2N3_9BACT|nr:hypothetical protein [Sulfurimonas lithotrophica]QFR50003.1 hypothetical protein FJR48_09815 [Sulfurimonas lithotrophica]